MFKMNDPGMEMLSVQWGANMGIYLINHPIMWGVVALLLCALLILFSLGVLRLVKPNRPYNTILLLPNDERHETYVRDVMDFAYKLRTCDAVTVGALSYSIAHIELLLEDDWKVAVVLE